jgi:uncharacterized membrane protein YhhN
VATFLWAVVVLESFLLAVLVVVTVADKPQSPDRWLIVLLPLAAAGTALAAKSKAEKRPKSWSRVLCHDREA